MADVVISVKDLKKSFKVPISKDKGIRHLARSVIGMEKYSTKKVIDGISFEVKKGECFGILGPNGTGKSTLLMLLVSVLFPDEGTIDITGEIVPLLQLGVGFQPELTAKDNVYLYGTLLGLSDAQLEDRIDAIFEYAELVGYEKLQLKHFSSGMRVRLAFSIAMEAKHDILLLDEVLSVGDIAFKSKSKERILEICNSGSTVVIVSHSIETITDICDRAMFLKNGKIGMIGEPEEVVDAYLDSMAGYLGPGEMVLAQKHKNKIFSERAERSDARLIAEIIRVNALPDLFTQIYDERACESLDQYLSQTTMQKKTHIDEILSALSKNNCSFGRKWAALIHDLGEEMRSQLLARKLRDRVWENGMLVYGYDELSAFFSDNLSANKLFTSKNLSIAILFSGSHVIPVVFDDRERIKLDSVSVHAILNNAGCTSPGDALLVFPFDLTHRTGIKTLTEDKTLNFLFQVPVTEIEENPQYFDFLDSLVSLENFTLYDDSILFAKKGMFDMYGCEIRGFGYNNPSFISKDLGQFYREISTLEDAFAANRKKTKLTPDMFIQEVAKQNHRYFSGTIRNNMIDVQPDTDTIKKRHRCFGSILLFIQSQYNAIECYRYNHIRWLADQWFKQYLQIFSKTEPIERGIAVLKLLNYTIQIQVNRQKMIEILIKQ